jgi:plasmid stabilization system protein ParE
LKVTLHPGAEADLAAAAACYRGAGATALGERLLGEFERCIGLLLVHPEIGTPCVAGRRSVAMRTFPYTVVYRAVPRR